MRKNYKPPDSQTRLTVKTSSSKLREAIRPSTRGPGNTTKSINNNTKGSHFIEEKRNRSIKKSYVLESESEDAEIDMPDLGDDDEEEDEEEDDDTDDDGLNHGNIDGDVDMGNEITAAPTKKPKNVIKQLVIPRSAPKGTSAPQLKQKQVQFQASDEDELSELESNAGEEDDNIRGGEEDAEGEEDLELGAEDDDEEPESGAGSQASTHDINKLTKRQRARLQEDDGGSLIALPDEVQVKKHLTAEEHAMRRAEMARRRKNLSEKRNEEEKLETINKLLKKQAPKTNSRRRDLNAATAGDNNIEYSETPKPDPTLVRWISSKRGNQILVPQEWLDGPVGDIFMNKTRSENFTVEERVG
ncbi:BgTH12-00507 [Blumeria graminis f. sp. triticale]|uniref:Bgt-281 n=3 Tax=Blumeria graminis TaxID=34373 RepID=A0A381LJK9_BLUGR|nr:hypothetical protein BGT96224_281 [Blumeria graminis f. sp. tritici 96224]CAD6505008.1 BgTH12-00507 [Blumeria graminis f. sp. triticale]VDB93020.1 Bgt-281 [Blumeria graminis f. sp. tritici]